ncbi:amidohydrolase family protein [Pseudemcibacter aquimaris]|uniref:amidohydrolase family protein n=1 Tax=Pseudemcibacter aquimaris TaxID=2857064 RepID=UPI002012C71F|nr:amidohydrolase family protein [Pseudemcibacter aquimaris]MCC3860188.1 amidohydrolase family protein [Pseudemcibacter aquimaris]WDU57514.1 amidohydrolase family protein [Pseudemcibacter aquimaris]
MKKILALISVFIVFTNTAVANDGTIAFVGARIIDGTDATPLENGVLVITDGRIRAMGYMDDVTLPDGTTVIDVSGKTIMPGIINAHGHVGDVIGLQGGHYTADNLLRQLSLYARYGVTTVNSLGGDGEEGFAIRDIQNNAGLNRARIMVAGSVVSGTNEDAIRAEVNKNADMGANYIKMRLDDNLGRSQKMPYELFDALLDQAHNRRLPLAVHLFYLDDAKYILRAGADLIAHSIRDKHVDDEFVGLIKSKDICYVPTLTREVSAFAYAEKPEFFNDPFFLKEVDPAVLRELMTAERRERVKNSPTAAGYKAGLNIAMENIDLLNMADVKIAMGTDTGVAARFQGYFEHMEMHMMADAGMSPMEIIRASTGVAAACIGAHDVGTLTPGKWGDLVVLSDNPAEDIRNTKSIESVWIAGNRVPD